MVKYSPANAGGAGDMGSIPGSGRYPEKGNGNSFQYSCLKSPMDRGAWQATVHGVTKSQSDMSERLTTRAGYILCVYIYHLCPHVSTG